MKNSEKIKGILFIAVIILIGFAVQYYFKNIQEKPKIYTVGTISKVFSAANMETHAGYSYAIGGQMYENSKNIYGYEDIAKENYRFIVSVPIGYPDHGVIMFDHPVPDGIEAPAEGWKEIPTFK